MRLRNTSPAPEREDGRVELLAERCCRQRLADQLGTGGDDDLDEVLALVCSLQFGLVHVDFGEQIEPFGVADLHEGAPALRTNIAPTVIAPRSTAEMPRSGSLRPINESANRPRSATTAESGSTGKSAIVTPIAVMAMGTGSVANMTSARRSARKRTPSRV